MRRTDAERVDAIVAHDDLDLVVDSTYVAPPSQKWLPIHNLLPGVKNQGGFRIAGPHRNRSTLHDISFVVLHTTGSDPDWPDFLDQSTGLFTYYGDNRTPGHELHASSQGGNALLRECFDALQGGDEARESIPPFFVFSSAPEIGRAVTFRGLAVPGAAEVTAADELVAVWRSKKGKRFQNYRATFTILDEAYINRGWLESLSTDRLKSSDCPKAFKLFAEKGKYAGLSAPPTLNWRKQQEQEPTGEGQKIIREIHEYFEGRPTDFEPCAAEIWRMCAGGKATITEITPPSSDGGRDALGFYSIGPQMDPLKLRFSLEAKCYRPGKSVGVGETKRLLSRLRYRDLGVIVSTSHLAPAAYREIREDGHPVVVITASDIVSILQAHDLATVAKVKHWLRRSFPPAQT